MAVGLSAPITGSTIVRRPGNECSGSLNLPTYGNQQCLLRATHPLGLKRWRKWTLFGCSCLLVFLLQLDMASVAVALPRIAKELKAKQVLVFMVATAYFLAQTVLQLVFSHLSHGLGRRYAYLSGVGFYIMGAIIATTSLTAKQLVGARAVQGMGAAGMTTMSAIVIVDIMKPRQRAACSAISQAFGALGNICGPVLAGLLFKRLTWRSVFVMQAVIASVLFLTLLILLPQWHIGKQRTLEVLRRCDWVGILLFLVGSIFSLIPINAGGSMVSWRSPLVIACLLVGFCSLAILGLHQQFWAKRPAFPREIFTKGVTNAAFLGSLVSGMLLSMIFYNLVLFWEGVQHLSTVKVGIKLLSVTLTYAIFAAVTGVAVKIWGKIRWASIVGTICATIGLGLMYLLDDTRAVPVIIVISVIAAAGCGMMVPAVINTVLATTDKEWQSHAIAMRTLLYTAGQCIGISVGLAIFSNRFEYHLAKIEGAADFDFTPQSLMSTLKDLPPDRGIIQPMVFALRWVWGAGAILGLLAGSLLCSYKCPSLPKDKASGTDTELVDIERQDEVKIRHQSNDGCTGPEAPKVRIGPSCRVPVRRVLS